MATSICTPPIAPARTDCSATTADGWSHIYAGADAGQYPAPLSAPAGSDIDDDGDLNLFHGQAGTPTGCGATTAIASPTSPRQWAVTGPKRTTDEGGVGCAVGDFDNDRDFDIFGPDYGHNQLYRRNGDRTFTEVAATESTWQSRSRRRRGLGRRRQRRRPECVGDVLRGRVGEAAQLNALFRNNSTKSFVNLLTQDVR